MGRPKKNGLDYFPLDVDIFRDIRVRRLKRKCGDNATLVYIALLTLIYNEGYYLHVDDDTAFAISEDVGFNEDEINAIIACSVELGLFSHKMYADHRILTSAAIQNRYLFIKDNDIERIDRYRLISAPKKPVSANVSESKKHNAEGVLDNENGTKKQVFGGKTPVSPPETQVSDPKTPVSPPKSAQSKVKKSKVKESKEKEREHTPSKSAAVAAADGGAECASLSFSTASPLFPYTEPVDRVDLRSELAPYVPGYDEHASEVDRLTQCGHPQNEVTGNLRLWCDMQENLRRGVKPEFRVPTFDELLRAWRAKIQRGEVPGIIPHNQWEALKWLGNSSQYTTSRRNRRFVVERTAQSWDTLAEMTETIASARANPATKNFSVASIVYAYAKKNLRAPTAPCHSERSEESHNIARDPSPSLRMTNNNDNKPF